jgi:hypothetical protein
MKHKIKIKPYKLKVYTLNGYKWITRQQAKALTLVRIGKEKAFAVVYNRFDADLAQIRINAKLILYTAGNGWQKVDECRWQKDAKISYETLESEQIETPNQANVFFTARTLTENGYQKPHWLHKYQPTKDLIFVDQVGLGYEKTQEGWLTKEQAITKTIVKAQDTGRKAILNHAERCWLKTEDTKQWFETPYDITQAEDTCKWWFDEQHLIQAQDTGEYFETTKMLKESDDGYYIANF